MRNVFYLIALAYAHQLSANFIWPAVGAHYGFFDVAVWLSIALGLVIEFFFIKKLVPRVPLKTLFMVAVLMNVASALFGAVFLSVVDVSLQHLFGLSWLWQVILLYGATVLVNICVESFVCLKFWPDIDKQNLISALAVANAISVGIALLGVKLF